MIEPLLTYSFDELSENIKNDLRSNCIEKYFEELNKLKWEFINTKLRKNRYLKNGRII